MYAILDIETTGGKFNEEGITEIAIYKFDGHAVVDQLITLVNPEKDIQPFVVQLTGINNKMLKNAPKFHEVAKRILEITEDCIIVAHNSSFDYRILKTEYKRLGYQFKRDTLCTVELSRKLIPDKPSYSLGKLCKSLGIPMNDRHRASGDALATIQLFKLLLNKDVDKTILKSTIKHFDSKKVAEKLTGLMEAIPTIMGVYYLHKDDGEIIFMGKGSNIKSDLTNQFVKTTKRALKVQEKIASISYESTGNMLLTSLKYFLELDVNKPKYNLKSKKRMLSKSFNSDNMLLIDKGRTIDERSIIVIENNEVLGYCFTNLAFQENQMSILKEMLTPILNKELAKTIIKNYLKNKSVLKIIRF
ncbi:Putative bifunctional exonuclease/endonuclease protein [Polaribacter huanghezhanensis]|uniref:3'-5' exonuclease n=1 Tax=Polaribacter huanghezhanensis TaxID=1354726 RepID=UPI00264A23F8|nr:3'-5' exonuclease [Polaribacter huanghezhanensis]WKD86548.1 Putative bifunctional exonuclease/endonuclease protein [Polaribacter huanghezhanensis]